MFKLRTITCHYNSCCYSYFFTVKETYLGSTLQTPLLWRKRTKSNINQTYFFLREVINVWPDIYTLQNVITSDFPTRKQTKHQDGQVVCLFICPVLKLHLQVILIWSCSDQQFTILNENDLASALAATGVVTLHMENGKIWRVSCVSQILRFNIPLGRLWAFDAFVVPGGGGFDHYTYGLGNLSSNVDFVLRVQVSEQGLINHDRGQHAVWNGEFKDF